MDSPLNYPPDLEKQRDAGLQRIETCKKSLAEAAGNLEHYQKAIHDERVSLLKIDTQLAMLRQAAKLPPHATATEAADGEVRG